MPRARFTWSVLLPVFCVFVLCCVFTHTAFASPDQAGADTGSQDSPFARAIGRGIGSCFWGSLIFAIFLRWGAWGAVKERLGYWKAVKISFASSVITFFGSIIVIVAMVFQRVNGNAAMGIAMIVSVSILVLSNAKGLANELQVAFRPALLASLYAAGFGVVFYGIIFGGVMGIGSLMDRPVARPADDSLSVEIVATPSASPTPAAVSAAEPQLTATQTLVSAVQSNESSNPSQPASTSSSDAEEQKKAREEAKAIMEQMKNPQP